MSAISGATVNSAVIRLMVFASWGPFPTIEIYIARNDSDWDEMTVTWNNKPSFAEYAAVVAPSSYDWWEIDVTSWVQDMVNGTLPNYGFYILKNDMNYAGFSMRTREGVQPPELVVDYTPVGLQNSTFGSIKALFR